ncbi:hypothetical protein QQF64_017150 [Cirrhinus molitorella]|uniref:Uncharacterized protein n=1 Tax=Cirrhinus molitorella TaxID=172907 RepID=A0ABR3LHU5_9TELE
MIFLLKEKIAREKERLIGFLIDTVIDLSQPQLMKSEVACAFRSINSAGPRESRSTALPIPMEETDGNVRFYTVQQPLLELCVIP